MARCVLLFTAMLSGCGFQLAGERPVTPALSSVYIDLVQPYRVGTQPIETALQSRIAASGGMVKSHIGDAKSVLRLSKLSETRETLSIGANGLANEYRLVTQVTFELHAGDQELIPPEPQGVSRTYSFSVNEVLGKEEEEARLRDYMQDELAALILLRIDAQLRHAHLPAPASAEKRPAAPAPSDAQPAAAPDATPATEPPPATEAAAPAS
jgi:LPS-assembly lipoprotein